MRIKLDENLPVELVEDVTALGHDVDSVESEGLAGQADPVVAAAARHNRRVLFTLDKGMANGGAFHPSTTTALSFSACDNGAAPRSGAPCSTRCPTSYPHLDSRATCWW
jgi:hypothetical protein